MFSLDGLINDLKGQRRALDEAIKLLEAARADQKELEEMRLYFVRDREMLERAGQLDIFEPPHMEKQIPTPKFHNIDLPGFIKNIPRFGIREIDPATGEIVWKEGPRE